MTDKPAQPHVWGAALPWAPAAVTSKATRREPGRIRRDQAGLASHPLAWLQEAHALAGRS